MKISLTAAFVALAAASGNIGVLALEFPLTATLAAHVTTGLNLLISTKGKRPALLALPRLSDLVLESPASDKRSVPPGHVRSRDDGFDAATFRRRRRRRRPAAFSAERGEPGGIAAEVPGGEEVGGGRRSVGLLKAPLLPSAALHRLH